MHALKQVHSNAFITHNISKHATVWGVGEATCIFNKIVAFFAISTGMIMHFSAAGEMEEMIENHQLITTLMFQKLQDPPVKNSKILNIFIGISQPKYPFFFF